MSKQFFLELAGIPGLGDGKKGPRRVATPEGAQYYGQPIGTIITADMIEAKRQENKAKGVKPQKGMLTSGGSPAAPSGGSKSSPSGSDSSSSGSSSSAPSGPGSAATVNPVGGNVHTQKSYQAPGVDSTPTPEWMQAQEAAKNAPTPQMALGLGESSLNGPKKFTVGDTSYSAPEGSRLIRSKSGNPFAVVITPDKQLHFFTDKGEVEADETIKQVLAERFGEKVASEDTLYTEEEFDGQQDSLDKFVAGQKLYNAAGEEIFTKTQDGWAHSALGIPVEDKDIQPLFESGELTGSKPLNEEEIDSFDWGDDEDVEISFGSMSEDEFLQYASTLDEGDELYYYRIPTSETPNEKGLNEEGPQEYVTVISDGLGKFTLKHAPSTVLTNEQAVYIRSAFMTMKPKDAKEFGTWNAETKAQEEKNKPAPEPTPAPTPKPADPVEKVADAAILESEAQQAEDEEVLSYENKFTDAQKQLAGNEMQAGEYVGDANALKYAPAGTTIISLDGEVYTAQFSEEEVYWTDLEGKTYEPQALVDLLGKEDVYDAKVVLNPANGPQQIWPDYALSKNQVGEAPKPDYLEEAPNGTVITNTTVGNQFYKNAVGWVRKSDPGVPVPIKHIKSLVSQNVMKIDEPQSAKVNVGALLGVDIDYDDFNEISMPGTVVVGYSEGNEKKSFTLNDLGYWNTSDVDEDGLLQQFEELPPGYAFYVSTHIEGQTYEEMLPKNGSPGEKPTVQWLEQSPVGSKFSISYTSKTDGQVSKAVLVKTDDNNWLPEDIVGTDSEDIFGADAESFQAALDKEDAAYVYQIEEIGNGTPPSFILSTKEGKSEFKDQGQIATFQNLLDSTNGTMFKYNKLDGTQSTYVKVNEDFILAPGGTFLRTKHWKKALDDGKVEFATSTLLYVQPDGTLSPKPVVDVPEVQNVDNPPEPIVEPTGDPEKDSEAFKDFVEGPNEWELELLNGSGLTDLPGDTKSELFYDAQIGDRWTVVTEDGSTIPSGTYELVNSDGMDAASDLWVFVNEDGALNDYVSFLGPDIYEEAKSLKKVGTLDIEDLVTGANEGDAFDFEGKAGSTIPNGVYVSTITDDGDGLQFFVYSNPDGSLDYDYAYGAGDLLEGAASLKPVVLLNITDDDLDSVVSPTKIFNSEFGASSEDIYEAIDVIENHPHASPVYGFKKVPNTNALKGHEDQIIADAKALYPKSAPKAAVLSYLKSMAGEPEPTVDTTLSIQIGAEKPAKNAFGVTGGTFTEKEISDALKILKAYGGKQFKSKLTQAGNPLGSLDFNSLVGKADAGDGGKLAQKQKVIDFLSEKYNAAFNLPDEGEPFPTNLPAPGEVQIEEYGEGWDVYNYEWVGDLDEMTTMLSDLFMSLPRYSKIQINPPGTPSEEYSAMKKLANGPEGWGGYLTIAAEDEGGELDVDGIAEKFVDAGYDKFYVFQPPAWKDPELEPASLNDVNAMPVGAKVLIRSAENEPLTLQKGEDSKWTIEGKKSYYLGSHVSKLATENKVWFVSVPPESTWIKYSGPVEDFEEFKKLTISTVVVVTNKEGDAKQFLKVKHNHWEPYNEGKPNVVGSYPDSTFESLNPEYVSIPNPYLTGALATPAAADKADEDGNGPGVTDEHSFAPGQYDSPFNGNVLPYESIFVFGDGTGYYNSDGALQPLTAAEVKNYPLNLWDYKGTSNPTPQPEPAPAKPKKAPASIGLADLPNGIYYLGNPNNSNTPTWKAKDGVVTEHLSDGTVKDVTATRLKNAVLKGKLVNKFGNSAFIPEGFEGSVSLLNTPTEIETLRKFRLALEKQDHLTPFELNLFGQKYGVFMSEPELKNLVLLKTGSVAEASNTIKTVKDAIDNMLGSPADYDTPDTGNVAEKYFEHVPGAPVNVFYLPEDIASSDLYMTPSWNLIGIPVAEFRAKVTKLADSFAGGGVIGQHVNKMSKYDLRAWVEALQVGNFKEMYALESKAAAKGKVSHNSGWKHPGYIDNSSTQSVAWGPVVPGEAPAGSVPDGNWSSPDLVLTSVGLDEIHNYMLAAGMTNGHYLNPSDRRAWVSYHRAGNSYQTNRLSGRAIALKKMGTPPWDPEFTWTDNVVPAKSYSSKFDKDPYPVNEWGNTNPDADAAQAYLEDLKDGNVELLDPFGKPLDIDYAEPFYNKASQDNPHFSGNKISLVAVRSMFQALRDWKNQEESKPIYSMAPTQNIKKSLHPIYNVNDQFGNKYVFKVAPNDVNSAKYRAEVEAGANAIALALGTKAPQAEVMEFNGKLGVMQKFSESEGTFSNFDMKSITPKQAGQLAHEHIADWMLDQDDNWGPNTLIDPNGDLVGIDKGRAFAAYGSWKGLVDDSSMDVNTHLVYSDFYQAIIKKQISKEVADAAWLEANRRALKISKMDKGYLAELLHKATDSRTTWAVPYKIDGKTVPQTQEGFFEAFFDRQDKLPEQVRALWEGIYKKAGYGDLPEPPKAVLGEGQHSGLDDANFHETVMTVGSSGSSTLLADPSILQGHAIAWTKKKSDGTKEVHTNFQLEPQKQSEVLNWFKANTDPTAQTGSAPEPAYKFSFDSYYAPFVNAAKTVNTHASDGAYNASKISEYENAKANLQKDIDFWSPELSPPPGQDKIVFPSGAQIPVGHVDQYKVMLDHYLSAQSIIDTAYVAKTSTASFVNKYEATDLTQTPEIYLKSDGKLAKLATPSTWIYSSPDGIKMVNDDEAKALYSQPGWAKYNDDKNIASVQYKATYSTSTHDKASEYQDGELTATGQPYSSGMAGREYSATLPTGEQIYFRNASATNTYGAQSGRVTVVVPTATTSADYAAGIERAREWLETNLGLNLSAATEDDAENIYWREMHDILATRKVDPGSAYAKAKADLQKKASDINSSLQNFTADFAKVASVDEQNAFYRALWADHFGEDKVKKLISSRSYLPTYEGVDPHFPEAIQGRPIWYRFDVDVDSLKNAGHMVGSKAYSADDVLSVAKSGAAFSTEERMRVLGKWLSKGSSSADQGAGGSQLIFTRIYKDTKSSGISFIYNPRIMLRTGALSYPGDSFGNPDKKNSVNADPLKGWLSNVTDATGLSGPELDIPYHSSLFGDLEVLIFDNVQQLQEAIQYLKKLGITEIRGVPIEMRLVMRQDLAAAIAALKKLWYNT